MATRTQISPAASSAWHEAYALKSTAARTDPPMPVITMTVLLSISLGFYMVGLVLFPEVL